MPRDLKRLAAPAVFCDNVRRSFRRRSPCRNVPRQRDRFEDDRESEYDDYAAEIASYNRLRRADRNAANSYPSASRHTSESLPYYGDSASLMPAQIDARYFTSRFNEDLRIDVPTHHRTSHISDNYDQPSISRSDRGDSQKRHKRKRRHHHCHSQNRVEGHSADSSSSRPARDTIAALKALADYGDGNYDTPSVSPEHHYVSPRKSERKQSCERRGVTAGDSVGSRLLVKADLKVTVNTECSRDDLSLGECTDDEDDESVDMHTAHKSPSSDRQKSRWNDHQKLPFSDHQKSSPSSDHKKSPFSDHQKSPQKSPRSDHQKSPFSDHQMSPRKSPHRSLPRVEQSEHCSKSTTDPIISSSSAVSSSTKKRHTDSISHVSEDCSMQSCDTSSNSRLSNAPSSSESKATKEQLPTKHNKTGSDHTESQSVDCVKHSPANKETSVVDDGSNTVPDQKRSAEQKGQTSESTQNFRKKPVIGDNRQKAEDDASLPRFVTYFVVE